MTTLRATLLTTVLVLSTGGSAHAAAPWSTPLTIGPPANGSQVLGLGFPNSGEGLLGWRLGTSGYVASLSGAGVVGPPSNCCRRSLPAAPRSRPARPCLRRREPATRSSSCARCCRPARRRAGASPPDRSRLSWALVGPDATLGRVHRLTIARCLSCRVKLAVNWLGEAVAVWSEEGGIRASWRPAGGRFGTPVKVFDGRNGQYPDLTAAIGSDGRAIVVDAGKVVRARVRTRNGRFGPIMRVGRGNESTQVGAAISNGGQAIVAWGSQDGGEEANKPWVVRSARLSRGGRRFSATQTLDSGSAVGRPEGNIALAFTPGGKATIAWSAVAAGATFPVMAASRQARRSLRRAAAARAWSGAVGAVAVRADGAAVVPWSALAGSQQPDPGLRLRCGWLGPRHSARRRRSVGSRGGVRPAARRVRPGQRPPDGGLGRASEAARDGARARQRGRSRRDAHESLRRHTGERAAVMREMGLVGVAGAGGRLARAPLLARAAASARSRRRTRASRLGP